MSTKIYDDFSKLPVDKMSQEISNMTYSYNQTNVPKSHYKKLLSKPIQEAMEASVSVQLVDTIYNTLNGLFTENALLFLKALICLDKNIKPKNLTAQEYQALQISSEALANGCEKKNHLPFINEEISDLFNDVLENGEHYIINPNDDK